MTNNQSEGILSDEIQAADNEIARLKKEKESMTNQSVSKCCDIISPEHLCGRDCEPVERTESQTRPTEDSSTEASGIRIEGEWQIGSPSMGYETMNNKVPRTKLHVDGSYNYTKQIAKAEVEAIEDFAQRVLDQIYASGQHAGKGKPMEIIEQELEEFKKSRI